MIFITDIGKDIDDAVSLVYSIISGIPLKSVVVTTKDIVPAAKICQNIIDHLSDRYPAAKDIKVYLGSKEPLKKGISHDNIYKGKFSKGDMQFDKLDASKISPGDAIVIGPLTDLARLMRNGKINRAIFMGQAKKDHTELIADLEAYNMRCDPFASEICFQYQDRIPLAFVGKTLAYRVPFTHTHFDRLKATGHPVGEFLKDHSTTFFDFFKSNVPDLYERIYKGTDNISYCYDPLTTVAVKHPSYFIFEKFGHHRFAVDVEADKVQEHIVSTIEKGLS